MKIKKVLFYIVMSMLLAFLTGCGEKQTDNQAPEKVTLNDTEALSNGVMAIIRHENLMEKYLPENTKVEWTTLAAAAEIRDGIVSGNIDIGAYAFPSFIIGEENGLPLRMVSSVGGTPIKLYSNDETIQSLSDFSSEDKIAVVGLGSMLHIAFLAEANEQGLDVSQYDNVFSVMPHADGLAALSGGNDVNGLLLTFPTTLKADKTNTIHEVFDLSDICIQYGINVVSVMSEEMYEQHPEIAEAFLKAQEDAIKLYQEKPDYVAGFLAEKWEIDPQNIKDAWEKLPLIMEIKGYDKQAELLYEMGLIENSPKSFQELDNYDDLMKLQGK